VRYADAPPEFARADVEVTGDESNQLAASAAIVGKSRYGDQELQHRRR